jgi:DNA invertase Pin-like site-specific DNA recombinase
MPRQPSVAIYARVSTNDKQTPDAQLRDLCQYARSRNWHCVEEFVDVGESGSKDSRPAWNELWDRIRKHRINVLLVHALDRIGRSLPHLDKVMSTLVDLDVKLVSFRENIDLGTAQGRMLAGLFSVLAEYELSLIKERTLSGMRAAKARGKQIGNRMQFFDVEEATRLWDAGWGQIRIARKLGVRVGRVNDWCRNEYLPQTKREKLAEVVATEDAT